MGAMPAKVKEPVEVGEQVTKPREKYAQLRGRLPDDINKIANESKEIIMNLYLNFQQLSMMKYRIVRFYF